MNPENNINPLSFGQLEPITQKVKESEIRAANVKVGSIFLGHRGFGVSWEIDITQTSEERCANFDTRDEAENFANLIWRRWAGKLVAGTGGGA